MTISPCAVAAERRDRKHHPIQVVVDEEIAGKTGAGVLRLVPRTVGALGLDQPGDTPLDAHLVTRITLLPRDAAGEQGKKGPRRLRRGGIAAAGPFGIIVGAHVFAPTAIGVLMIAQPLERPADRGRG